MIHKDEISLLVDILFNFPDHGTFLAEVLKYFDAKMT